MNFNYYDRHDVLILLQKLYEYKLRYVSTYDLQ